VKEQVSGDHGVVLAGQCSVALVEWASPRENYKAASRVDQAMAACR
jgi:hypothetical protein